MRLALNAARSWTPYVKPLKHSKQGYETDKGGAFTFSH